MGEEVNAGEEEKQEEILKVRPVCSQRIQARLRVGRAGIEVVGDKSGPSVRKTGREFKLASDDYYGLWAKG